MRAPWLDDEALCTQVDPDLWQPEGESIAKAKDICRTCPIVDGCREYAIQDPTLLGVWGATTGRDRRRIRVERGIESNVGAAV